MASNLTRAVIVVFSDATSDTEAAMIRNGLRMFSGVRDLIPVRGVPDERQARILLARDQMIAELDRLRQERDELAMRLHRTQEAVTGPVPGLPADVEPISVVFDDGDNLRSVK